MAHWVTNRVEAIDKEKRMAGRHAYREAAFNVLNGTRARTAAAAVAAGSMFGAVAPMGFGADTSSTEEGLARIAPQADVETTQADAALIASEEGELVFGQLDVTVEQSDSALDFDLDVAPAPVAPVVQQTAGGSSAGYTPRAVPAPVPVNSDVASALIAYSRQFIGTPYVYGGTSPSGFDCSGFTQYVYAQYGVSLPRTTGAIASAGYQVVSAADAQPGDLVMWGTRHVGIYTGNGQHIAAHKPGTPLSEGPLYGSYYFLRVL